MSSDYEFSLSTPALLPGSVPGQEGSFLREMGVIEGNKQVRPLVRKDLLHLIKENGGSAGYIDLSGLDMSRIDIRGMDLSQTLLIGCNLEGAIAKPMITMRNGKTELTPGDLAYEYVLQTWVSGEISPPDAEVISTVLKGSLMQGGNLSKTDFRYCNFSNATLMGCDITGSTLLSANLSSANLAWARLQEVDLRSAVLNGADLERSRIIDADLSQASLQNADLTGAFISPLTNMSGAQWDHKYICRAERDGDYEKAVVLYRNLKEWHHRGGYYEIAGEFHYREKEAERKAEWQSIKRKFAQHTRELKEAWKELWKSPRDS